MAVMKVFGAKGASRIKLGVASVPVGVRVFCFLAVTLLLLVAFNPVAYAEAKRIGKSGETVSYEDTIYIAPDDNTNWTVTQNIANETDWQYFDYNLTWEPFFENNTDLRGILLHNLIPPLAVELNYTENARHQLSFGSFFKILPDAIMDGVSEAWFRLPITDMPENTTISMRIWKVQDGGIFNMTFTDYSMPSFNHDDNAYIVYNLTSGVDGFKNTTGSSDFTEIETYWPNYRRWLNLSVPGSDIPFWYNFTYIKACFGLFPNEWYFVEFDLDMWADEDATAMRLLISSGDFGNDYRNNTWFWADGETHYMPVDLDTPILCTYGMSNGITGIGVRTDKKEGTSSVRFVFNASIPVHATIDNTSGVSYFNIIVPFLINTTANDQVRMSVVINFCPTDTSDDDFHQETIGFLYYEASYNFFIYSVNLSEHDGEYIDHIRVAFQIYDNHTANDPPNGESVKFWGMVLLDDHLHAGFTDLYWQGYYNYTTQRNWTLAEKQYFVPYGYYSLDDSYWTLTNMPIIVIPINTPKTPVEIQEALQEFQMWLFGEDGDGNIISDSHRSIFDTFTMILGDVIDWAISTVVKAIVWFPMQIILWIWDSWNKFINNPPDWFMEIFETLYGIGQFIWMVFEFLFDALEWFCYWAVRMIYGISIAIVYMVNIFGIITINTALLAVARSGNGKDFVQALRTGWKFILGIITLLISLAIMAISIVSAVVPF